MSQENLLKGLDRIQEICMQRSITTRDLNETNRSRSQHHEISKIGKGTNKLLIDGNLKRQIRVPKFGEGGDNITPK